MLDEVLLPDQHQAEHADDERRSGPERDEKWAVAVDGWPNYARYAERTDRELPLFWLTPR